MISGVARASFAPDLCWKGEQKECIFPTCPNENENSSHVVQSQGGRRVVIRIAAVSSPTVEDPLIVQVFHFAACHG